MAVGQRGPLGLRVLARGGAQQRGQRGQPLDVMMLVLTLLTRLLQDCLSMSGQDGYNWMDLQCHTRSPG